MFYTDAANKKHRNIKILKKSASARKKKYISQRSKITFNIFTCLVNGYKNI